MSKKYKILDGLILSTLIFTFLMITFYGKYNISINNNTDEAVQNLQIAYSSGTVIESIDKLDEYDSWKNSISTKQIQGSDSLILKYKDAAGDIHEETIVGDLKGGYSGKVEISLSEVNDKGIFLIGLK